MRELFVPFLLISAPSFAARLASSPAGDYDNASTPMQGLYAAIGGGGGLVVLDEGNALGYDVEGRLGYSFNPGLQLYLAGSVDGATITGTSFRSEMIAAFVQYHLYWGRSVGVYARAGIGVALSSSFVSSAVGLAEGGGLGVEIALSPGLFIAPELFYKTSQLSVSNGGGTDNEQVVGLQLAVIYY
ncbi:MAG: hypothetical protein ABR567_20285 [Myxococcales bacterium]|nr:hypothetical protein [Myxococcales bacterium]